MRQAFDPKLILSNRGDAIRAVTFGYDFCAEHERGIPRLPFGVEGQHAGHKGRVWTKIPEQFVWVTYGQYEGFGYENGYHPWAMICQHLDAHRSEGILSCWDDRGFLFLVNDQRTVQLLREFFQACQEKKACFFPSSKASPDGTGLCIAITSMFANEFKELETTDKKKTDAREAFEKTRAKAKLDALKEACHKRNITCWYPCYMGATDAVFNDKKERLYWLNDSRMGKPFGWMTDEQLCGYLDQLEKEFLGKGKAA